VLAHVPTSSAGEVAEDLKATLQSKARENGEGPGRRVRRALRGGRFPKAVAVFEAGISGALTYLS
jgi:hypothetical protein